MNTSSRLQFKRGGGEDGSLSSLSADTVHEMHVYTCSQPHRTTCFFPMKSWRSRVRPCQTPGGSGGNRCCLGSNQCCFWGAECPFCARVSMAHARFLLLVRVGGCMTIACCYAHSRRKCAAAARCDQRERGPGRDYGASVDINCRGSLAGIESAGMRSARGWGGGHSCGRVQLSDPVEASAQARAIQDAIQVLPKLLVGLDVNVRFNG